MPTMSPYMVVIDLVTLPGKAPLSPYRKRRVRTMSPYMVGIDLVTLPGIAPLSPYRKSAYEVTFHERVRVSVDGVKVWVSWGLSREGPEIVPRSPGSPMQVGGLCQYPDDGWRPEPPRKR